jgi:SAM-dependent methyltransferase
LCRGKADVLEAACGAGQGLGYLAAKVSGTVTGCDIDDKNLDYARKTYLGRKNIRLLRLDAHAMNLPDSSFDAVILYEAVYYLAEPSRFIAEALRVLRPGGIIVIVSANKDSSGFNPSPHSLKYFSAPELRQLLESGGFIEAKLYGDCPAIPPGLVSKIVSALKRIAVQLRLMPKTMKGKELLKRIFMGRLKTLPCEITDDMAEYTPPVDLPDDKPAPSYKVIFAVARKQ